jgi:hypothetical protein
MVKCRFKVKNGLFIYLQQVKNGCKKLWVLATGTPVAVMIFTRNKLYEKKTLTKSVPTATAAT